MTQSKADICIWNLEFTFIKKEPCKKFVAMLLDENIDYTVSFCPNHIKDNTYTVQIQDMHWAKNLSRVAELLEEVDYESF